MKLKRKGGEYQTEDGKWRIWREPYPPRRWFVNALPDNDSTEHTEGFEKLWEAKDWLRRNTHPVLEQIIESAPIPEVSAVVGRLQSLPEYAATTADDRFAELAKRLAAAIEAADEARRAYRQAAGEIYNKARTQWTAEEIRKATGYDD